MKIIHLNEENFDELINSEKRVLVDFFAEWCGPCKMFSTVLENANIDVTVIKVDTDKFDDLARKYGVMSIPTIILFEDGKEVKKNIGFLDKYELEDFLK